MTDLSDEELIEAAAQALARPTEFGEHNFVYFGKLPLFESWGLTFTQTRDSDTIARSNYRRILADLREYAEQHEGLLHDADPDDYVQDFRSSHWLCGWVERIAVKVLIDPELGITRDNITPTFIQAAEIGYFLEAEGPVYDESDHSDLECEEDGERWGDAIDDVKRSWDEEDDGPEPTDDEWRWVDEKLHEQETPEGYDPEEVKRLILDRRPEFGTPTSAPDPNQEVLF